MSDGADFLYPMIEGDQTDASDLLVDLARSASEKATASATLTDTTLADRDEQIDAVAQAMADRFAAGGRLFTFGNGGSATDAAGVAALFARPPRVNGGTPKGLAARSLVSDESILTALANDVGFEVVFSRQIIAHARSGDIAMGFSTSGNSPNVIKAFEEADGRGILTIGLAGYDGGAMAACDALAHCIVVVSDSVHRIQEAQSATAYELWRRVQERLT
jgi:D-sedoheptulose 7-phosphate isomerase